MRTLITLENSNCTRCHNGLVDALRETDGVHLVRSDFTTGCLVVEHEGDPDALMALITTADRAVAVAGNGEREMVPVGAHEASECWVTKVTARAPLDGTGSAATATSHFQAGAAGSAVRSSSGTGASGVGTCPVCRSGAEVDRRGGERGGVRVLMRERPAPGLFLRAVRHVVWAFRDLFGVPAAPN